MLIRWLSSNTAQFFSVTQFQNQLENNGIISYILSSCIWAVTAVKWNFKENPESGFMNICVSY